AKALEATCRAEPVLPAGVDMRAGRRLRVDAHPAHGIDRRVGRRRWRRPRAGHGHEGQLALHRGVAAPVRSAILLQLMPLPRAASGGIVATPCYTEPEGGQTRQLPPSRAGEPE